MRRRTRRRGSSGGRRAAVVVAVLVVAVAVVLHAPSAAFTAASLDRNPQADVVADGKSVLNLSIASDVTLGTTAWLTGMTNELESDAAVTVELRDGSGSVADLVVNGETRGDAASFTLAPGEQASVSVAVECDGSLSDDRLHFDVELDASSVDATVRRSVPINGDACGGLVYATPSSRDLRTIRNDTGVTRYDATSIDVVAPMEASLDGDGRLEIPFVNASTGDIYAIDDANETTLLLDASAYTGVLDGGADAKKSRMAVGAWNGSEPSVFFVDDGESYIYRVDDDETQQIVKASNGASAVLGVLDIDGDGAKEVVFVDGSAQLRYVEEDGTTVRKISNGGVGSNNGVGAGQPADFDGDGTPRVPFVDGSGYLSLVTAGGNKTILTNEGSKIKVDKAPLAAFDWDGDGRPEIIAMEDGVLYVVDNIGGDVTVTAITSDGSTVDANPEPGPA